MPLPPLKNALGVDVDQRKGMVYWSDTGFRKIQRAYKDGSRNETIIEHGIHTCDDIAIDSAGRKIYWTDGGRNSIEVAELDGSNRKLLIWTSLDSPRAIALHYEHGYMFWSDWGTTAKIERADMDGENRRVIIDTNIKWPNGLAIDRIESRLYWNDAKVNAIESSDFDGNNRRTLMTDAPYPYGLVIVGQHIYWTDWKSKALHRADKTNGANQIIIRENLDGLMDIRAVKGDEVLTDACGENNGGCSHLCLRTPEGFSCACPTGFMFENETDVNPKICKPHPDNFLVFATKVTMSIISLDTPENWDVILPIKNVSSAVAVDFHWEQKLIFFTDVDNDVIRSINMNNMSESKVVIEGRLESTNGISVDWIANNLYWTDNDYKVLEVARLDGSCRRTLIKDLAEPRAITLLPEKGLLFWSDWGEIPMIERAFLDGSDRKAIVTHDLGFPNGLTIDFKHGNLYWTDGIKDRIETSDLNGQHRVQLIPIAKNAFGLTQFNDYIYWTDWYRKSVIRANKTTGKNITLIRTDVGLAMEIRAVSAEKQIGWNLCKIDNGGCTHLCLFRGHDFICLCPDIPDNRTCIEGVQEPPARKEAAPMSIGTMIIAIVLTTCVVGGTVTLILICVKLPCGRGPPDIEKEDYPETSGHISFHNPNYSCASGSNCQEVPERRPNRFQGIFKYDRSQERVTNVYIPEGTCLLPTPPPPPHRQNPMRRSRDDDFEPVTLHPFA